MTHLTPHEWLVISLELWAGFSILGMVFFWVIVKGGSIKPTPGRDE